MVRKHFETSAKHKINDGQLIKTGHNFTVRYMDRTDLPQSIALQQNVMKTLKANGKTHYIIPKDEKKLRHLLDQGNAIIGTFIKDGQAERLGAHMIILYPQTEEEAGLADPSHLPGKDIHAVSVVSNILVHQDFRGNRLMQQMLDAWLDIAQKDGKKDAVAEVCADNEFSWNVFLDCGFVLYAAAHDDRDGSDVVYLHKPLDREFIYSADPEDVTLIRLFDKKGDLDPAAHRQLKDLLKQGYHGLSFDRDRRLMLLAKCVGTVPLAKVDKTPSTPGNDNKGPK
ncbi:MAG: GNAT family N-acetyltransferase [Rhodospirillales bacterium]|nr:GNAT family N-acetyltransferase [Rhodospirillales bacterium]MCB9996380.1 GNAT family N-acetyltransferase [Rhodospirillales bacterium]